MNQPTKHTRRSEKHEYWVKLHPAGRDIILAACDSELLEKTFSEDELSITVHKEFYGGILVDEEGLKNHIKSATILNLVGERCISVAEGMGWVDRSNSISISGGEHAQAAILFDDQIGKG